MFLHDVYFPTSFIYNSNILLWAVLCQLTQNDLRQKGRMPLE